MAIHTNPSSSNIKAETYDTTMWRRLIDINITGSFLVAQAVGKQMITSEHGGSIIFIASMSGSVVNYPQEQCKAQTSPCSNPADP